MVATVPLTNVDKVDMLFVIDNSSSMAQAQAALREQFAHLVQVMSTGDRDGDGREDFPPVKDLHLGVVTTDMGLPGVEGVPNCAGLGQDGLLQNRPAASGMSCQPSYPPFLSFNAAAASAMQTATDIACLSGVGTSGCAFTEPLEAALKALWPSVDPMASANGGKNRIQFLSDPKSGRGALGHADVENAGFVRNDFIMGLSLIAITVLSNKDDCSIVDTHAFTPAQQLASSDPLAMQGLGVRCHFNQSALYPIDRYVNGFKALRPDNENLIVFAAIAGVPSDLTNSATLAKTDFSQQDQRDRFYQNLLTDPRMQEVVQTGGTPDPSDDKLVPSCNTTSVGVAEPPIRIVNVAQRFGENAIVRSICDADLGPAVDDIVAVVSRQLGAVCLPRRLTRNASGLLDCDLIWELPRPGTAPASTPTECGGGRPWLLQPGAGEKQQTDTGGNICKVAQLAVHQGANGITQALPTQAADGQTFMEGWYYDDFSDEVQTGCTGNPGSKQRIAFTPDAHPPFGVTVKLQCLNQSPSVPLTRTDLAPGIQQPSIGADCATASLRGQRVSGDAACELRLSKPSSKWPDGVDKSMFCHPEQNICVLSCASDTDCPKAWTCDDSSQALAASGARAFCTMPTCSAGAKSVSSDQVGHACLPDVVPDTGFDDREAYLGVADDDCGGGVCLTFHLRGDPRKGCVPTQSTDPAALGHMCAAASEVASRVYCSCRCNAPAGYAECGCPSGFACIDVLDQGGPEVRGGYCVKNGTSSTP